MLATRESWLEERKGSVGGSEAATVMGCNPFDTSLALYARKRGEIRAVETNLPMMVGHHMESFIDERYQEETGRQTVNLGEFTIQRRGDFPSMHATWDRQILPCDGHDMPGAWQGKNVGHRMSSHWIDGEIPLYVQVQIQHEMFVGKVEWGSVAALLGGNEFVWQDVERHDGICRRLVKECESFMRAVRDGTPPEATADDGDVVRLLNPTAVPGKTIELPDVAILLTDVIDWQGKFLDRYADTVKEAKARLIQLIGDAETAELPGGNGAWTCKTVKKKAYDVKASETRQLRRKK